MKIKKRKEFTLVENTPYQHSLDILQCTAWVLSAVIMLSAFVYMLFAHGQTDWFSLILGIIFVALLPLTIADKSSEMRGLLWSLLSYVAPILFSVMYGFVYSPFFFIATGITVLAFIVLLINVLKQKPDKSS